MRAKRQPWLTVLLVVVSVNALVAAGIYVSVAYPNSRLKPVVDDVPAITFRTPKDHPVTATMVSESKKLGGAPAPAFTGKDMQGNVLSLASMTAKSPVLLYFIEYQCPCCKSAKPYIDRVADYYGDACNVIGIIDCDARTAKAWTEAMAPQFRVIADPTMKIIREYKATHGTYTVLIAPGGKIVHEFPGYCQSMLKSIGDDIARLNDMSPRPMLLEPAPKRMTSGCIFPGTKLPGDEL